MDTQKFELLKAAARLEYGEHIGAWAYDTWRELNARYFAGELEVIPITFGLTAHGRALGFCSPAYPPYPLGRIVLHASLLEPGENSNPWQILPLLGKRFASDVLLHEMVHQHIYARGVDGTGLWYSSHNNEHWCKEVNRLAGLLELDAPRAQVVKRKRIDNSVKWKEDEGCMALKDISTFPHSFTSEAYYRNESEAR